MEPERIWQRFPSKAEGRKAVSMADQRQYVSDLCTELTQRLPHEVRVAVRRIRAAMPGYRSVDEDEHNANVLEQAHGLLAGIDERRAPNPDEVKTARRLGARRAAQGLGLDAVVGAYHLGCQQMWDLFLERAHRDGCDRAAYLLEVVNILWVWVDAVTSAAADGYSAAMQAEQVQRLDAGHRLLEALYAGQAHRETTALIARSLGFEVAGRFSAACLLAEPDAEDKLERLRRACHRLGATAHAQTRSATLILIVQAADPHDVLVAAKLHTIPGGIGLSRPGLDGLAMSIRDAEKAIALAAHRRTAAVDFGADWLSSILFAERVELEPILRPRCTAVASHFTDAVAAYAAHGFSIAAAGEALHVHANTIKYRLERWRELTGWDPRTLDGLLKSTCSIALGPWDWPTDLAATPR